MGDTFHVDHVLRVGVETDDVEFAFKASQLAPTYAHGLELFPADLVHAP